MKGRKAKIVCTLGPASSTDQVIDRLIGAGMDVARLNFSHGTHDEHAQRLTSVRRLASKRGKPIAIIADLQGPKIRTGTLEGARAVLLRLGQRFVITTRSVIGNQQGVSTTFKQLPESVRRGSQILLRDGEIALRVLSVSGSDIVCRVENAGELGEHQGICLPGLRLGISPLTNKDFKDLRFALEIGVEYIALSFVRRASDILLVKKFASNKTEHPVAIIAKLEKPEAIDNLDEILKVSDGVMVARGDLGVEMRPEQVPVVQKRIIRAARNALVPVITATQMLDSMKKNPRPTRAEASDVANAIFDGSDALMLSAETAAGLYPVQSVDMMSRIIFEAEANALGTLRPRHIRESCISEAIAEAVCHAAEELHMKAVVVFTETGYSAQLLSKYRPKAPIISFSPNQEVRRRLSLLWGVDPKKIPRPGCLDQLAQIAEQQLLKENLVKEGDIVGIIAGTPIGSRGTTNFMRLVRITNS